MWLKRNDAKRFICMIITIVISVYPMSLSPVWNGTIPGHRDQYGEDGTIYFAWSFVP